MEGLQGNLGVADASASSFSDIFIYCGYVHQYIFQDNAVPFEERKRQLLESATSELRRKPPEYVENLTPECESIGAFFNLAARYENCNISQLDDLNFSLNIMTVILERALPTALPSILEALKLISTSSYGMENFLRVLAPIQRTLDINTRQYPQATAPPANNGHRTATIDYKQSKTIISYLRTKIPEKQTENILKLIYFVHRNSGFLKQFIATYAPSLTGKTQLAYALDKYAEYPLSPLNSTADHHVVEKMLFICLRVACEEAFLDHNPELVQPINENPFSRTLKEAVSEDCLLVEANKEKYLAPDDCKLVEATYSVSSLSTIFRDIPSYTIGYFVGWIKKRISKEETEALLASKRFQFNFNAKTLNGGLEELTDINGKPIVIFLDEYCLNEQELEKQKMFLLLRNILRAFSFVVVLMGTNATALNMTDKVSLGSLSSANVKSLWAQVVVNFFTSSMEYLEHDYLEILTQEPLNKIFSWVKGEKCCLRPGFLKVFLEDCLQGSTSKCKNSLQLLDRAFDTLHLTLIGRKPSYKTIKWLTGQVEALLSQQNRVTINGVSYPRVIADKHINNHYAYLTSFSKDKNIPLFALFRQCEKNELELYPIGWSESCEGSRDINLDDLSLIQTAEVKTHDKEIKNFLDRYTVIAPCQPAEIMNGKRYCSGCAFPSFEVDEMGYIGFFHTKNPFPLTQSLRSIASEKEDPALFVGLERIEGETQLTTRAALTLTFRYSYGFGPIQNKNPQRSGTFVEIIVHSSIVIASHKFGLGGSKFSDYLPKFIGELSLKNIPNLMLNQASIELLGSIAELKVPLFPLINAASSKALDDIPGVHTGIMEMCYNVDEFDGFGFPKCIMVKEPLCHENSSFLISNEEKVMGVGKSDLMSVAEKLIDAQIIFVNYNCGQSKKPAPTGSIFSELPCTFQKPKNHVHFFVVAKHARPKVKSQVELHRSFENVTFLIASHDSATQTIRLSRLYDSDNEEFKDELEKQLSEEGKQNKSTDENEANDTSELTNEDESVELGKRKLPNPDPDNRDPLSSEDSKKNEKPENTPQKPIVKKIPEIPIMIIIIPFEELFPADKSMIYTAEKNSKILKTAKKLKAVPK